MNNLSELYNLSQTALQQAFKNKLNLSSFFNQLNQLFSQFDFHTQHFSQAVPHILITRLDEIGDVVLFSAFLRELRRNYPLAYITLVVKEQCYELVEPCPYVNQVLVFDSIAIQKSKGFPALLQAMLDFCYQNIWSKHYDLFILPRYDHDMYFATFLGFMSGATRRVGFSSETTPWKKQRNQGFDSLLTDVIPPGKLAHEVEHNLEVIRFLGGKVQNNKLELWTGQSDELWAEKILSALPRPIFVLSPGKDNAQRNWPVKQCLELAQWLVEKQGASIVLLGGPGEEAAAQAVAAGLESSQVVDLTAKTTLRQSAAVLRCCSMYVGRNTGLMHMAAAAGIRTIEITCHARQGDPWHMLSPFRFGPWGVPHAILQPERPLPPCQGGCQQNYAHCITQISVDEVKQAIVKLEGVR